MYQYILIVLCFTITLISCNGKDGKRGASEVNLVEVDSNSYTNSLFVYPVDIEKDKEGNLYISDQMGSQIVKLGRNQSVQIIGSKGRGPGQYDLQSDISIDGDKLIVNDQNNLRLQYFNFAGEYIRSFLYDEYISDFIAYNKYLYSYIARPGLTTKTNLNKKKLIHVFDEFGKKVNEFGEHLTILDNLPLNASDCLIEVYDNKIYVLFKFFPIMRVYSLEGKLLDEYNLQKEFNYQEMTPQNYDPATYKDPAIMATRYLFRAFDVTQKGIYVGLFSEELKIDLFNFAGHRVRRYTYDDYGDNFYLHDFIVTNEEDDSALFYLLVTDGDSKVELLKTIED
ncbi:MAG: hypothetical protein FH748_15200 [Balneolaceae bacterium]|nr:hypothetical protein [Balneolaceae bacterium]